MEYARKVLVAGAALFVAVLLLGRAQAADQGITGKKLLLKSNGKLVLLSKDSQISIAGSDPVAGSPSSVTFDDGSGPVTFTLPESNWSASGSAAIFKYKNALAPAGPSPVKTVKLKNGLLKLVSKGLPFGVPTGAATVKVVLELDGGTNTYCSSFTGTGDGSKFLVKDAAAGTCEGCGNSVLEGSEECDGSDDSACPAQCQSDCTCPVCGDNVVEGAEQCDGSADAACPNLCLSNCSCDLSAQACCQGISACSGVFAGYCIANGGTPIGNAVCSATGDCVTGGATLGPCCAATTPFPLCGSDIGPSECGSVGGAYNASAVCLPSGACAPCEATTGGYCWFLGADGASCDDVCAAVGLTYDSATLTYAGSDGVNHQANIANCAAVLDDLGTPTNPVAPFPTCGTGLGCFAQLSGFPRVLCGTPPTISSAAQSGALRACACR